MVLPQMDLHEALAQIKAMDLGLMPYEVLEGGFSDAEASQAKEAGLFQVGLGKRILRTETVASAMLSMIMYEKNEI